MAKADPKLGILRKFLEAARLEAEVSVHGLVNEDGEVEARKKLGTMFCRNLRQLFATAVCPNVSNCKNARVFSWLESE
jgi:hypothetical protein